jgi:hypothetical protein
MSLAPPSEVIAGVERVSEALLPGHADEDATGLLVFLSLACVPQLRLSNRGLIELGFGPEPQIVDPFYPNEGFSPRHSEPDPFAGLTSGGGWNDPFAGLDSEDPFESSMDPLAHISAGDSFGNVRQLPADRYAAPPPPAPEPKVRGTMSSDGLVEVSSLLWDAAGDGPAPAGTPLQRPSEAPAAAAAEPLPVFSEAPEEGRRPPSPAEAPRKPRAPAKPPLPGTKKALGRPPAMSLAAARFMEQQARKGKK